MYAKADFLALKHKKSEAIAVLDALIFTHNTHAIIDQALLLQAKLFEQTQHPQKAKENYLKIIADFPSEILIDDAHFALAELFRTAFNQPEKAMNHYEEIIFNHPDSIHFVTSKKHYRRLMDKNNAQTTLDL